jgi:EAL domain-containing protein (putative c-di-GMP-specific phosphodiesterase class I)/CheY-like chemotaxis protein
MGVTTVSPVVNQTGAAGQGRVLVVDDQQQVLFVFARSLQRAGFEVSTAEDGFQAEELLSSAQFDVILSDIDMPGLNGIQLLRAIRSLDLDVPVILATGQPDLETAMKAIEYGAFRYLVKPVEPKELVRVVTHAARLGRLARIKRHAVALAGTGAAQFGDVASLEAAFNRALAGIWIAHQPVVFWSGRRVLGYESLMRSDEPLLPNPVDILGAAEKLRRLSDVGRATRRRIAETIPYAPEDALIFVNLHPTDLTDEHLHDPGAPLSKHASRIIFEITERSSLEELADVRGRVASLRQLGFRIAIDDLGAGYAGLSGFSQLEPDVVKLDMTLIRDIDDRPIKRNIVRKLAELCRELGMMVVAEGVETGEERRTLVELGCELLQGYLFAKPALGFPQVAW